MGSVRMCKDYVEFNYESKYKCPKCGGQDRAFKISSDMYFYESSNENVRFETCSCGKTLRIETLITVVGED